jgi:hypothetical protein
VAAALGGVSQEEVAAMTADREDALSEVETLVAEKVLQRAQRVGTQKAFPFCAR